MQTQLFLVLQRTHSRHEFEVTMEIGSRHMHLSGQGLHSQRSFVVFTDPVDGLNDLMILGAGRIQSSQEFPVRR